MGYIEGIDNGAGFNHSIAVGAVLVAGDVHELCALDAFVNDNIIVQIRYRLAIDGDSVLRLNGSLCNKSLVFILSINVTLYIKSSCVLSCSKLSLYYRLEHIGSLRVKKLESVICTENCNSLAAGAAYCITPTICSAGGFFNYVYVLSLIVMCVQFCYERLHHLFAAGAAIVDGQTLGDTIALYENVCLKGSAYRTLVLNLSKGGDGYIVTALAIVFNLDAGLLLFGISFDVDDVLIFCRCTVCQSSSGNQRSDHENSHQHAQQSLFHFLLFTSVKIVG